MISMSTKNGFILPNQFRRIRTENENWILILQIDWDKQQLAHSKSHAQNLKLFSILYM